MMTSFPQSAASPEIPTFHRHPFDRLIGHTLFSALDLFNDLRKAMNDGGKLPPFQRSVWQQWVREVQDHYPTWSPHRLIRAIMDARNNLSFFWPVVYDPVEIHAYYRKSIRFMRIFSQISVKVLEGRPLSVGENAILNKVDPKLVPYTSDLQFYSHAEAETLWKLEKLLNSQPPMDIDWNVMAELYSPRGSNRLY